MNLADQPAFPMQKMDYRRVGEVEGAELRAVPGMTYRQWLVGMALQGLVANGIGWSATTEQNNEMAGKRAVKLADAAIRAQEGT